MPISTFFKRQISVLRGLARAITSPPERYRHAQGLHSIRVALAMLASIGLTTGIHMPHGSWAAVSLLVVIGGLQHQGNIRKKAGERALGTLLGAALGLALVLQLSIIGSATLTYVLLSISAGACAYYAIGRGGYLALLTAITMCIIAGDGNDSIEIGLWRTATVLVGIGIALLFSFALPLFATYSWRFCLAKNLRRCATIYQRIMTGLPLTPDEQIAMFSELDRRLVTLRGLMPSVAKETGLPLGRLVEIQRQHRALLSALEMMASVPLTDSNLSLSHVSTRAERHALAVIPRALLQMARALRSGSTLGPDETPADSGALPATGPGTALDGPHWLLQQMTAQAEQLRRLLRESQSTKLFSL